MEPDHQAALRPIGGEVTASRSLPVVFALTIIATIAAVISAGVAVWQAGIARKAQAGAEADAAEAVK